MEYANGNMKRKIKDQRKIRTWVEKNILATQFWNIISFFSQWWEVSPGDVNIKFLEVEIKKNIYIYFFIMYENTDWKMQLPYISFHASCTNIITHRYKDIYLFQH